MLWLHFGDGEACGSLLADKGTKACLRLNDAVWDAAGLAQGWQPHDDLNRVNIVGDDDQLSLLLLHELGHVVDAHLDAHWLLVGSALGQPGKQIVSLTTAGAAAERGFC